jgi:thiol-disulfide isomerase/thioredoxin
VEKMLGIETKVCRAITILAVATLVLNGRIAAIVLSGSSPDQFAPLEQWKNAVLAVDSAGLKMLYSTNPAARVTSGSKTSSVEEELNFWIGLRPRNIRLDVVQSSSPQPGTRAIVFQAEVQPGQSGNSETVYVNEAQAWQQQGDRWRLISVQRTDAAHLQQPLNKNKDIYPANADARAEIKEAEEKAAKENKRVLLVFGANWCYDCHVLDLAFQRPDFQAAVSRYEVVHVDIGDNGKKNADVAKQFQVPLGKGIPALAVVDSTGRLVVSQKNGEFENARAMTPEALLDFLNKWKGEER